MSERGALLRRAAPLMLVLLLGVVMLLPATDVLRLAPEDAPAVERWTEAVDELPDEPIILVGFDPDLGTYAEIRATVRAAVGELLADDARLVFVSLTPEGRALLLAEIGRLERATVNPTRMLDLGFVPGAEAALVSLAAAPTVPAGADGALARRLRSEGTDAIDALLVVGGNDLGPRSWVEQFAPRVGPKPVLAIAPTVLLPEVVPYLESGQLAALLATPRDGAAYRAASELGALERLREPDEPEHAALLAGLVVAIVVLGHGWVGPVAGRLRSAARDGERG